MDRIGISYMYLGAWKSAKDGSSGREFHVDPYLMVVGPPSRRISGIQSRRKERNAIPEAFAEAHGAIPGYAGTPME